MTRNAVGVRIVADTNTIISGLLWYGAPRQILDAARIEKIEMFTSALLLDELLDVLRRPKFTARFTLVGTTLEEIFIGYRNLATLVEPKEIDPVIYDDPDDDAVLACAITVGADIIVSGDKHLLRVTSFEDIPILQPSDALSRILNHSH